MHAGSQRKVFLKEQLKRFTITVAGLLRACGGRVRNYYEAQSGAFILLWGMPALGRATAKFEQQKWDLYIFYVCRGKKWHNSIVNSMQPKLFLSSTFGICLPWDNLQLLGGFKHVVNHSA